MKMPLPLQVIVIDDVCRLALYVWRHLSRSIGYGIGEIPDGDYSDGRAHFWRGRRPRCLSTATRGANVWWVNTAVRKGPGFERQIRLILERIDEVSGAESGGARQDCRFLVDVRKTAGYTMEEALKYLKGLGFDLERQVRLVSSYASGYEISFLLPIYSKTAETFHDLWREICERFRSASEGDGEAGRKRAYHILVTGAGFELAREDVACARIGVSPTEEIVKKTLSDYAIAKGDPRRMPVEMGPAATRVFSVPKCYKKDKDLKDFALGRDLDEYWNRLLELELQRAGDKFQESQCEYLLRELFRRRFLDDDRSYLNQALDAAHLSWDAWLTTNYTRFADRAIDLVEASQEGRSASWRTISTSNEAARLLREILHGEVSGHQSERLLFKLHGDIAHLTTMAVAGHDKDLYSPLTLPIDSLHSVYAVAESYLMEKARGLKRDVEERRKKKGRKGRECSVETWPFVWHIVGHSLQDPALVRLFRRVYAIHEHQYILFVNPQAKRGGRQAIKGFMKVNGIPVGMSDYVHPIPLRAEEYLARLRLHWEVLSTSNPECWAEEILGRS